MSADTTLIKSYGTALFEAAKSKGVLQDVAQQAEILKGIISKEDHLIRFLNTPNIPRETKEEVFNKVFGEQFHKMLIHFVDMLIRRGRYQVFLGALEHLHELYLADQGSASGSVTTATELSGDQKAELLKVLNEFTGKKLELEYKVDPKVIGGIRFLSEDLLVENTMEAALNRLKQGMAQAKVY